jgi:hypothetical protein
LAGSTRSYECICNWLSTAIQAQVGHTRVYNGWVPETVTIAEGTEFVTFVWDHADPDKYTFDSGVSRPRVTTMYFEILVWKQGKDFVGIVDTAAGLVGALDVYTTTTADGTISGAERYQFKLASWTKEA